MSLTVLSVAFPLTPVGPDAVGGSLQRRLVATRHHGDDIAREVGRHQTDECAIVAQTRRSDGKVQIRLTGNRRPIRVPLQRRRRIAMLPPIAA